MSLHQHCCFGCDKPLTCCCDRQWWTDAEGRDRKIGSNEALITYCLDCIQMATALKMEFKSELNRRNAEIARQLAVEGIMDEPEHYRMPE